MTSSFLMNRYFRDALVLSMVLVLAALGLWTDDVGPLWVVRLGIVIAALLLTIVYARRGWRLRRDDNSHDE